ncbi:MAG: allantoinase AllB [Candidatus Cloacimonetes bacterium]|nr:allantoinase AllB [Candidatus Cloacimonadota bacterium]MCF7813091.1 allantoinase AllB [Candidatus Cloacimonadota bacterium]MCF7867540.1 allantoinase AllB [Candidatus Cloacimonadota bacterium]MCF7883066.1 allantoinase AllB [Candidatus Cloacimonadota bacterium]
MKLIKNAVISNDKELVDILYEDKIIQIGKNISQFEFEEIIDLEGKILIPGCIDAHVHFNDPGYNEHEDFITGTTAAAFGGITTIIDMPCTSIPPVTNTENLESKLSVIRNKAVIDFALWGGIRRNDFPIEIEKIHQLWKAGIVGFKIYTISGMDTFAALSYEDIKQIFERFPEMLFAFHAEDAEIIKKAADKLSELEKMKPENYLKSRPAEAEVKAVGNILELAEKNHLHFVHISTKKAAESILKAKSKLDVSWETCPHYLQFTAADFPQLKGRLKTAPPVKCEDDKKFLRAALKTGKVDFITTDHAGCDWKTEKDLEDFSKVYNGIPGTQLMIPYLLSEFYVKEKVPLSTLIKLTSENAARRYGLFPQKGSLQIGSDADFTVIDQNRSFLVNETKLKSKGKYSPFHGQTFSCSIAKTIVRGETVFDREKGLMVDPGFGNWVKKKVNYLIAKSAKLV